MKHFIKQVNTKARTFAIGILFSVLLCVSFVNTNTALAEDLQEELNVQDRTGLEEFNFVEETFDDSEDFYSDEVVVYSLDEFDENFIMASSAASYWESMQSDYIYEQLSDKEKQVWDELESICIQYAENTEDCVKFRTTIGFDGVNKDEIKQLVKVFYYSHPQYFFLSNTSGVATASTTGTVYPLFYIYDQFQDGEARHAAVVEFETKINAWSEEVNACDTIVAKEKKAFEIIADNTIYSKESSLNQSTYSMVCEGKTVCAGYCGTFAILMNMAGVETQVITGIAGEAHGWDSINVHGIWYLADPTWADQNDRANDNLGVVYQYLNRADSTISANRVRDGIWEKYYHPAQYDSGQDGWSYVDPYFEEGDYKYFTVNNNMQLAVPYMLAIETLTGETIDDAPNTILFNSMLFYKYCENWEVPRVSMCIDDQRDCSSMLAQYTSKSGIWSSNDTTVATVDNGIITGKQPGKTVVIASVDGVDVMFEITVADHDYGDMIFNWAEDGSSCSATTVCSKDASHTAMVQCVVKKTVIKAPTCVSKGTTHYYVDVLGNRDSKDIEDIAINKENHVGTLVREGEKPSTATADGFTGNLVCEQCKAVVEEGRIIPKLPTGWVGANNQWYYYNAAGVMVTGWKQLGAKWYYFDTNTGLMQTGWKQLGGKWYYFSADGYMTTGWKQISGKWYYFNNTDGYMTTGWKQISNRWYYFDKTDGYMTTGWKQLSGKWYYFNKTDGYMITGWKQLSGKWYYFDKTDGYMITGWKQLSGKWYYFDTADGYMVTGWKQIGDKKYYFDPSTGEWVK